MTDIHELYRRRPNACSTTDQWLQALFRMYNAAKQLEVERDALRAALDRVERSTPTREGE